MWSFRKYPVGLSLGSDFILLVRYAHMFNRVGGGRGNGRWLWWDILVVLQLVKKLVRERGKCFGSLSN